MYHYTLSSSSDEASPCSDTSSISSSPCATPSLSAALAFARTCPPSPSPSSSIELTPSPSPSSPFPTPSLSSASPFPSSPPPRALRLRPSKTFAHGQARRLSPRRSPRHSPKTTPQFRSPFSQSLLPLPPSPIPSSEQLNISDDVYESYTSDYIAYTPPPAKPNVFSRTLSIGKGVIGTVLSYLNVPSVETKIATLAPGQAVTLDDVISIEKGAESSEFKSTPLATMSQLMEPITHLFSGVTEPGFYKVHISDAVLLHNFRTGGAIDLDSQALLKSALQTASFAVSKSQLTSVTRSLDDISAMLDKIGGKQVDTKLGVFIQEAEELWDVLTLLASVPSSDVQKIDFDTRVGRLKLEAKVALEEAFITIEEHKTRFKQTLQRKGNVEKEDLVNAAHIFAQLCMWVKLSIFLANLLHLRDIICGNDASYIQISSKHLLSSLDRSHRLHAALQMFSPALLRKHGMFSWVKGFFYIEQPKLLRTMRRWRTDLDVANKDKVDSSPVEFVVAYDPSTYTLRLAEEI